MRTIISGRVTPAHLESAALFGVEPTSYVTNGESTPPVSKLPVDVYPLTDKLEVGAARRQRNYTLVQNADALILVGRDDHLAALAQRYGLVVFQEA